MFKPEFVFYKIYVDDDVLIRVLVIFILMWNLEYLKNLSFPSYMLLCFLAFICININI